MVVVGFGWWWWCAVGDVLGWLWEGLERFCWERFETVIIMMMMIDASCRANKCVKYRMMGNTCPFTSMYWRRDHYE